MHFKTVKCPTISNINGLFLYETAYITLAVYAFNTFVPSLFISVYPLQYISVIVSSCVICFMVKSLLYLVS